MSNRLSKQDRLRFSGPELGDLLDRVVTEHGEEAAIAAVNRVRSGGVAGFFCREEFEVIVDPDGDGTGVTADLNQTSEAEQSAESAEPAEPVTAVDPQPTVETGPAPGTVRHPNVVDDDDETIAEAIARRGPDDEPPVGLADRLIGGRPSTESSAQDRALRDELRRPPQPVDQAEPPTPGADIDRPVFGGPVAPGSDPGRDRFLALLERRLDAASAVEDDLQLRRARPTSASPAGTALAAPVAPAPTPTPSPALASPAPAPAQAPARTAEVAEAEALASTRRSGPALADNRPVFWRRLDRVRAELASFVPASSTRTAVVGPLPLAAAVVNRLQATAELASAEVVALTDRAGIVSQPSWRLERSGDRLVRSLAEETDRPVIVVIDVPVDLPHWVGSLQRQLRSVGVGLFRYAVSGQPSTAELERYRQGADVPYAIDLASRVEPSLVANLVADRHPIVSVAGADLGPELLLALRRHVGAAELLFEPVIDG